ncbi:aminotransferase class V-fold PLP-dependent enzyme [Kibdelosporangium philippinense]|uniref:Aminotransferase class V-fold PLP-dependent enzyme n=1 Tax=Kibdelosporangium philippinense TaxID=211113 RepID=A0ABS8ZJ92_9PSEU|nr:aminotransferase class V-fold PLP-dependent enzyme [Kibdelosporangium philippinense]MCE7007622.1 aminotransferase class V-fold PLP-dependent enzyme [Kibdelosporangium philippinense]
MRIAFGQSFDVPAGYLNTASIGIPPKVAVDGLTDAVRRWRSGADTPADFDADVRLARKAWGALIGVEESTVASGASVSQLMSLVATSIPDGTRVLAAEGDFTSVTFPFASQEHRGVTVTEVGLADLPSYVDRFDLVAVSVVQSATGAVVDLEALRDAATAAGTAVVLDVTQAAGWMPLKLDWADWVIGACYKWLMSARGAAWLAVKPEAFERTIPIAANWYAGEDPAATAYGLPLRLAPDARRFDLSPVWFSQLTAAVVVPWLASLDIEAVRDHCVGLADGLLVALGLAPQGSAIVSLDIPHAAEKLAAVGVKSSVRAGRARLACHLYNTAGDIESVLSALRD